MSEATTRQRARRAWAASQGRRRGRRGSTRPRNSRRDVVRDTWDIGEAQLGHFVLLGFGFYLQGVVTA